jgi:two-component system, NtrC family, sensor kinase
MKQILILSSFLMFLANGYAQGKTIDSLKQVLAVAKEDTGKLNILDELGNVYVFNDPDSAIKYSQIGLVLARKLNFEQRNGTILWHLAFALSNTGDYPNALQYWYQSISVNAKLRDTFYLVFSYLGLADCYIDQSDYSHAQSQIIEGRRLANARNDKDLDMYCDRLEATVFEETHRLDSASYYITRAYPLYLKDPWGYQFYITGEIEQKSGHDSTALTFYRKAISVASASNSHKDLVDFYNAVSQLFWNEKKADSAVHYTNIVIEGKLGNSHRLGTLRASNLLAEIYEYQKRPDSAIKYLNLTIAINDSLFSQQKTRAAQNFAFIDQLHQQELQQKLEKDKLRYRNLLNIYILLGGLIILLGVALGLWRRNIFKQRSLALLQKQKQETDDQKAKAEKTLEELKSTQAQLIQAEKMASLGELTAGIAHEIQNPLNFVNNFSEVNQELIAEMEQELDGGNLEGIRSIAGDIRANEEKIAHHGRRADAIVKSMLQHSRTSAGQKEPVDINALANEYLRLSYHGLRAKDKSFNATIQTDFDPTIGKIGMIPQDIGRVLLNLYNNALYFVSEKAKTPPPAFEPTITVSTKRLGDNADVRVKDNGMGVPQKVIDKIFQPFFTTKPAGQGTGLGLSMSYDIIKAHGGEIKVETKEGEGALFIIQLPIGQNTKMG